MSFVDNFFEKFLAPWFTIDGITYGILDLLFLSIPFCAILGIIITVIENRRRS